MILSSNVQTLKRDISLTKQLRNIRQVNGQKVHNRFNWWLAGLTVIGVHGYD